jgi:hypothetical protein
MESPHSTVHTMFRSRCATVLALAALAIVAFPATCLPAGDNELPAETIDAIWHTQLVDFTYSSRDVYYSCNSLRSKIGAILRAVGAHENVQVSVHCIGDGFVNHAQGRVRLSVPIEATPENVQRATTYDTRHELVARLRKLELPTANDIERFPASWHSVSLTRQRQLRLDSGDCDLLRAVRRQIFPKMPVRVSSERLHCALGAATRMRPNLDVVALMRAPTVDSSTL